MTQDETRPGRPASGSAPYGGADDDSFRWSEIRHFLYAPLRRPVMVLGPWFGIVALSVAALFVLPKKYMSSTFILVESEKMPESFIPKVATGDRTQRLEAVKPEILSRTRLERVLEETEPYPDLDSKTRAVEKMRQSIFINVSGNDGLSIEFYHRDPHKAQQVTDRLASLFIEETIKSREQQVEGAVDFLVGQVKDAARGLENKDAALRSYKEQHMGRLPEQLQTNLATMQMLQREAQTVEESLFFAREKQDSLARGMGRASAGAGAGVVAPAASADLSEMRRQLAALRTRYTEEHPDVQSLRTRIARLEARVAEASSADAADVDPSAAVARSQLERANQEVRKLEDRQRDLQRRISSLRANVEETPRTEQELATLTRDYEQLKDNYTALLSKQMEAQMSGRLEQRWKGDRFRMLDPANLPERPVFPKPTMFLGLGAILGLLVGLGVALAAEFLDPTVKDSESLLAVQGHPVLACIPHTPSMIGTTSSARLVSLNRAAARHHESHRRDTQRLWAPAGPGEVGFHDDGVATPSKVVPIVDCLRDHNSFVAEELRLLVANVTDICRRRKDSCIAFTSALPGEGKSTVSLGLAGALARDPGRHVLLIEADLRRPTMASTLGLPPGPGLSEWLNGTLDTIPVRLVEPAGFYLVTAGQTGLRRPEILGSPRMDALLRAARSRFDFVILDSVPLLPVADAILMQDLVDGFVLVARSRLTPRDAVLEAIGKLRSESVVGMVLNDHREYRGSYKDHFYRRYGTSYGTIPPGMTARAALEPAPMPLPASTPEPPAIAAGGVAALAGRTAPGPGWADGPATGRIVPAALHEHPARQSVLTMPLPAAPVPVPHAEPAPHGMSAREAAAGLTFQHSPSRHSRRKIVVAAVAVMLLVAALGYVAVRPRLAAMSKPSGEASHAPVSAETAAALERVRELEHRLQTLESDRAAAEASAVEDARKKVIAQAAARGRAADPTAVARALEEARRQAQAEQEKRTREEQERLRAEQRAAEERLAEQRRKDLEAPAAATETAAAAPAVAPPTTLPAPVTPPTTPPAVAVAAEPPVVTTRPGALVSLNDPDVIAPVLQRAGQPNYPPAALLQRVEATVQILVLVDETGAVADSKIAEGVNNRFGFNEAALGSVRGRKYRPATKDGLPVKVWVPVRVQFKLP